MPFGSPPPQAPESNRSIGVRPPDAAFERARSSVANCDFLRNFRRVRRTASRRRITCSASFLCLFSSSAPSVVSSSAIHAVGAGRGTPPRSSACAVRLFFRLGLGTSLMILMEPVSLSITSVQNPRIERRHGRISPAVDQPRGNSSCGLLPMLPRGL